MIAILGVSPQPPTNRLLKSQIAKYCIKKIDLCNEGRLVCSVAGNWPEKELTLGWGEGWFAWRADPLDPQLLHSPCPPFFLTTCSQAVKQEFLVLYCSGRYLLYLSLALKSNYIRSENTLAPVELTVEHWMHIELSWVTALLWQYTEMVHFTMVQGVLPLEKQLGLHLPTVF